jgi:ATP synthase F1 delta subunit
MINVSRRKLAQYAADQLLAGQSAKKVSKSLAAVLIENGKVKDAELLVRDITFELETLGNLAIADVTSATALSSSIKKELERFIKRRTEVSDVKINESIDKSVIGGVHIETSIHAWDKTISNQLNQIREAF